MGVRKKYKRRIVRSYSLFYWHIVIIGEEFVGCEKDYIGWRRVLAPTWNDEIITPKLIGEIIDWCLLEDKEIQIVNWKGEIIG